MVVKKRGLGRGLDSLLGAKPVAQLDTASQNVAVQEFDDADITPMEISPLDGQLKQLPVEFIQRGKYQPRRDMAPEALEELAESIKAQGVMQPIVVRSIENGRFEIIAGERRWRATQMAGIDSIPVIIREVSDEAAVAMALIENIQREDLNPIEEAAALQRLQQDFELTQQEIADAVGKSRSTVTNLLRLMSLKEDVRLLLENGDLEMGHGRALLGLPQEQQSKAASVVVSKGFSVRQTEAMVRRMLAEAEKPQAVSATGQSSPDIRHLEEEISQKVGAPVRIQHGAKGKGKLILQYNSLDELDGILNHIK